MKTMYYVVSYQLIVWNLQCDYLSSQVHCDVNDLTRMSPAKSIVHHSFKNV